MKFVTREECPACQGTGRIDKRACNVCGGTGENPNTISLRALTEKVREQMRRDHEPS